MTLPFISYGGWSMISLAYSVGMLLALTRLRPRTEMEWIRRRQRRPHGARLRLSSARHPEEPRSCAASRRDGHSRLRQYIVAVGCGAVRLPRIRNLGQSTP